MFCSGLFWNLPKNAEFAVHAQQHHSTKASERLHCCAPYMMQQRKLCPQASAFVIYQGSQSCESHAGV